MLFMWRRRTQIKWFDVFQIRRISEKTKSSRRKDGKSSNLMLAVTTLKLKLRKRKSRVLIWTVAIITFFKTREIKCLINSEAKKNFISQVLIKDAQLFENVEFSLKMQIVNECIIISYNTQKFSIAIIDSFEYRKNDRYQFYVVNMRDYDMILKLSWLKKINSNIQWFDHIWIYREDRATQTK